MSIKSTIFKASLQIADIDHGYYADHTLTLARHPSETDERMMVRLLRQHVLQNRFLHQVVRRALFERSLKQQQQQPLRLSA